MKRKKLWLLTVFLSGVLIAASVIPASAASLTSYQKKTAQAAEQFAGALIVQTGSGNGWKRSHSSFIKTSKSYYNGTLGTRQKEALAALSSGWAAQDVTFEAGNGWVMGLHGAVFSKEQALSRAELAEILNRILGRTPQSLSDLLVGMPLFSDNLDTEAPYFLAMQEAAIDHTARACGDGERWTGLG